MARVLRLQTTWARGELDPYMLARTDTDFYFAGAKRLENLLVVPQGGVARRPGLRILASLPARARLAAFEFNVEQTYIVAFSAGRADVFDPDGNAVASVTTPYSEQEVFGPPRGIAWAQSADTMVVVHENHPPHKLMRHVGGTGSLPADPFTTTYGSNVVTVSHPNHGLVTGQTVVFSGAQGVGGIPASELNDPAGHAITRLDKDSYTIQVTSSATSSTSGGGSNVTWSAADYWTFEQLTLQNIPKFNFADSLTPTTTDEIQEITFTGTWADGDTYRLQLERYWTATLEYSSTPSINEDRIREALQRLPNTASDGTIVVEHQGGTTYRVTFTGEDGNKDWPALVPKVLRSPGGGLISVDAGGQGASVDGASGFEDVWSNTRGWPRSVAFHEGRLWFGGSPYRPTTIWGSVIDDYFNFDLGAALDDDGISATLDAGQLDAIEHIVGGRHLQVLTSGGEYVTLASPVTPRSIAFKRHTRRGAAPVPVAVLGGMTIYVERDKQAIRALRWDDLQVGGYVSEDLTLLARHLATGVMRVAAQRASQGDYVWAVRDDGTGLALSVNLAEGIIAWSRIYTRQGDALLDVASLHGSDQRETVYFAVSRSINGQTAYYLERLEDGARLDGSLLLSAGLPTDQWSGLDKLEGETVWLIGDGVVLGQATVSNGSVTTPVEVSQLEVGFDFSVVLETMPAATPARGFGDLALRTERVRRVGLDVADGADIYVNGVRLADRKFGQDGFQNPAQSLSGVHELPYLGYGRRPTVVVEQKRPAPLVLRGLEMDIEVAA